MRIDYVQQHAGNAAVYIRKRQRPYAHQCLEKFNIFTSESTKKQEKRGKEVAGWRFLQKIPSFTKKTCKNFPLLQNSCKNFPLLQKSPKKSKKTSLFYKKTSLFYKKSKKTRKKLEKKPRKKPKNRQKKENRHSIWYLILQLIHGLDEGARGAKSQSEKSY